ncbi:MAG: hypothetical protein RIQ33_330 [Bacteroidota bacterium]
MNFHTKWTLGFGLEEEAIRVLKELPNDWLTGLLNNEPVDVEVSFPIIFNLE